MLIEASDPRGLFYGAQTLRQLITSASGSRSVPNVEIRDSPRFRWRGLLIDLGRHFFGKQVLFKVIDEMAAYKLNVLKLHLTDYEGWRVEIPAYPKLTQVGSLVDGKPQYLSTADVHEVVQYAAERHIIVVPEIEMPGHAGAAARSYPEYFNPGGSAFNPANPKTYDFIREVLTEVARLFPAPYLDFAGDEVGEEMWKGMADVDRLKAEQGLKTNQDIQAYFGRKVVGIIKSLGKRPMAWDEQVEAQAPNSVIIQWWRRDRPDVLTTAANGGHDLVISPADELYFDYHQGEANRVRRGRGIRAAHNPSPRCSPGNRCPTASLRKNRRRVGDRGLRLDGIHRDGALSAVHDFPTTTCLGRSRLAAEGSARRNGVFQTPRAAHRSASRQGDQRPTR